MRKWIFVLFLLVLSGCRKNELRLPDQPAISGLAQPVFLFQDTTWVDLNDYFLSPEKIKKIHPVSGLNLIWHKYRQQLGIITVDSGRMLMNIRIRCDHFDYDIPVIGPHADASVHIQTDRMKGDTIFLRSSALVTDWAVYFQNYKLGEAFLCPKKKSLGVILPEVVCQLKEGILRIWARDSIGVSNKVGIPLKQGEVITEVSQLNDKNKEADILYACEINEYAGKEPLSDSLMSDYRNPSMAALWQKMTSGYFEDLGINTLCLTVEKPVDSLFADLKTLTEAADDYKIKVVWNQLGQDTIWQEREFYGKTTPRADYDRIVTVFARNAGDFRNLPRSIPSRIHSSGDSKKARFMTRTNEYVSSTSGDSESQDTVYRKLIQFLAYQSTIPGNPMIYAGDEIGWSKRKCPSFDSEEWNSGQFQLKSKLKELNRLRGENMALFFGDFIPLRVESQVYAYLRNYFGREVLVVFNKKKEMISLKLDLPVKIRTTRFRALFGNRFSYDNSKMILDVPANGVEIIYN